MSKRMAYFSDVSGNLIEGDRVRLRVSKPDGTIITIDGSENELKVKAPTKEAALVSVGLTFPDNGRKKPIRFKVREADLRGILTAPVHDALGNGATGTTRARSEEVAGTFACACGREFAKQQGLTRHITSAKANGERGHRPA